MDQLSAHLDRGWDLIGRNDPRGAEASARRALELDPNSPEAYNLLGYSAALEGNAEDAVEAYRQAIALDDTFFEAILNAAEVYIHPLGDFREAITMCDQALDLAENDEELIDALLLKFDAVLGEDGEDSTRAREVLALLPAGPFTNPGHAFLIGRAHFELGELEPARALLEDATRGDPDHPEAWYYLGLLREELGESRSAVDAFLHARELDLSYAPPSWAPITAEFRKLVHRVVSELDPVLGSYVRQADVFVGDVPGFELVADGVDPRALLLFDGLYLPDQPATPCARIFVYQRNVERVSGGLDRIEDELRAAFEREITITFLEADAEQRPAKELN